MKFMMFSGSLRSGSLNKKLLAVAQNILQSDTKNTIVVGDIKSLDIPVYDGDIETAGMPRGVVELGKIMAEADAIIVVSPEYNNSIAGSLKNTIDWLSRLKPVPYIHKPVLLMGASPGPFGSVRGLIATRAPFEALNAYVFPVPFALIKAGEAFTEDGALRDEDTKKRLQKMLGEFVQFAEKFKT